MQGPKTLTPKECRQLLDHFHREQTTIFQRRKQVRDRTIALLMLDAGCRRTEVTRLLARHAYWNGQVRENLELESARAKYRVGGLIPISPRLAKALEALRTAYHDPFAPDRPLIYTGEPSNACPLSPRQVERVIATAADQAIGRHVYPHMLRHTFGDELRKVTDSSTAQRLLRHKHLSSTEIYFHSNQDDATNAIRRLHGPNGGNGDS